MVFGAGALLDAERSRSFDVICAGQPVWRAAMPPFDRGAAFADHTRALRRAGLSVGWAAVIEDDRRGRALLAEMDSIGVGLRGVDVVPCESELVVVDAAGHVSGARPPPSHVARSPSVVSDRVKAMHFQIPAGWSSRVLLLSGLRPLTDSLAAFCKAARGARRHGTIVVLDLVGALREWSGHDPRLITMVLREADVVRSSFFDLALIGVDGKAVRSAMRPNATLVVDGDDGATAVGPFGEITVKGSRGSRLPHDSPTAAICVDCARPRGGETPEARWQRILRRHTHLTP